jgi:hypothetical protein
MNVPIQRRSRLNAPSALAVSPDVIFYYATSRNSTRLPPRPRGREQVEEKASQALPMGGSERTLRLAMPRQ